MAEPVIYLENLSKSYLVTEREAGVAAAARSLIRRRQREIKAVDRVSFEVQPGEVVGFLGPNGAGKTTTLKMLAGLLHPTSGVGRVLNYQPWQRKRDFLKSITLVMGQRNQLNWDIPAIDSFELNRVIYRVPLDDYKRTLTELTELLELTPLISKPVRNLSLGERMKCEIAAALLHQPQVLFLDEPTIGLDVTAQRRIREFIREYNQRHNATILLTSHYMADVEALCQRVVVIHHGRILFDGALTDLVTRFSPHKTIGIELENRIDDSKLAAFGEVISQSDGRVQLRVPKVDTAKVAGRLLAELPVSDLTIEDPPIEEVIEQVFAQEAVA
ncbi:MAG: ATP-binding cassette domain-containing protein [Caldilineaceae bacterium]